MSTDTIVGRTVHPVCALFPLLPDADATYRELVASIRTDGQREPIVIDEAGAIIDGRHRLRACTEIGIEPKFITRRGTPDEIETFAYSVNLHRRHLTPEQRAMVATLYVGKNWRVDANERRAAAIEQRKRNADGTLASGVDDDTTGSNKKGGRAHEEIQNIAKVGQHTARQAIAVAKESSALAGDVLRGDVKLADAAKIVKPKQPKTDKPKARKLSTRDRHWAHEELKRSIDRATSLIAELGGLDPAEVMHVALLGVAVVMRVAPMLQYKDKLGIYARVQTALGFGETVGHIELGPEHMKVVLATDEAKAQEPVAVPAAGSATPRRRGRPPKKNGAADVTSKQAEPKRPRGRPRKNPVPTPSDPPRKRGRPRKNG